MACSASSAERRSGCGLGGEIADWGFGSASGSASGNGQDEDDLRRKHGCHQIILRAENGAWQRTQAPDESLLFAIGAWPAFAALYKKLQTFPRKSEKTPLK